MRIKTVLLSDENNPQPTLLMAHRSDPDGIVIRQGHSIVLLTGYEVDRLLDVLDSAADNADTAHTATASR